MYEQRALELRDELRGRLVAGWRVDDLIHHGNSAAVFRAQNARRDAALKIFDPELIARYGEITQLTRIERELELRGHHHPHLVEIFDGGRCSDTSHHFLVMELVPGRPLGQHIDTFERARIPTLVREIASAAKFLEDLGLVHRDIKPANIVIDPETSAATLLDLGVLRPINSQSAATDDGDLRHFVGTLQYSPPEFLLREEEDTIDGWRAVTFYQIGAVLHDLIERRPIFSDHANPYARLVNAVQHTSPTFTATDVPHFVNLARNCLVKPPDTRLRLVAWDDLLRPVTPLAPGLVARQRLAQARHRISASSAPAQDWQARWRVAQEHRAVLYNVEMWLRQWCVEQDLLPPVEVLAGRSSNDVDLVLDLHFRPAPAINLHHHLLVHFGVRVHDASINAVELLADAIVSTSAAFQVDRHPSQIYRGIVTEGALRPVFENTIYPVFELAIRDSTQSGRIDIAPIVVPDVER